MAFHLFHFHSVFILINNFIIIIIVIIIIVVVAVAATLDVFVVVVIVVDTSGLEMQTDFGMLIFCLAVTHGVR